MLSVNAKKLINRYVLYYAPPASFRQSSLVSSWSVRSLKKFSRSKKQKRFPGSSILSLSPLSPLYSFIIVCAHLVASIFCRRSVLVGSRAAKYKMIVTLPKQMLNWTFDETQSVLYFPFISQGRDERSRNTEFL